MGSVVGRYGQWPKASATLCHATLKPRHVYNNDVATIAMASPSVAFPRSGASVGVLNSNETTKSDARNVSNS